MSVACALAPRLLLAFSFPLPGGRSVRTCAGLSEGRTALPSTRLFRPFLQRPSRVCGSAIPSASVALALAFGSIAAFPGMASRSVVVLLALAPLAFAMALFSTMGNFFPGYLMLVAGTAALIGGVLHHRAPSDRAESGASA